MFFRKGSFPFCFCFGVDLSIFDESTRNNNLLKMKTTKLQHFLLVIFILLIISSCSNDKSDIVYSIDPPFENIKIEKKTLTIDPSIDQIVRFSKEVSIEIPANAFCDNNGNLIKGTVDLSVELYDSKAKIMASGIPMKYHEGEQEVDFESAGMLQIEGLSNNKKINIVKGKELTINHKSQVAGDFDFFYFQEEETPELKTAGMTSKPLAQDVIKQGQWKKLSQEVSEKYDTSKTLKNFKLKFASSDYSELLPLESIQWHLATPFRDPTSKDHNWVLNTKWSSLEISDPKKVLADKIFESEVNQTTFLSSGAIMFSPDEKTVVMSKKPITKIWSKVGKTVSTINGVSSDFQPVKFCGNNYLLIEKDEGVCLYSTKGDLIGNFGETHGHEISLKSKKVIYYLRGDIGNAYTSVFLADFSGKVIKKFELKNEPTKTFMEESIYSHFVLTPEDKLITNSAKGINVYDLNGNEITSKEGEYSTISYLENNSVLCRKLTGQLIVWNYKTNKTIESKAGDFDIKNKLLLGTWYTGYEYEIKNRPYIIINPPTNKNSSSYVWNYKTNETIKLNFYTSNSHSDSLCPEIISGYNWEDKTYKIYNLDKKRELVSIANLGWHYEGFPSPKISKKDNLMLIDANSHIQLRKIDGTLIKDFKKYDSLIQTTGFVDGDKIYTLSEDGIYKLWDKTGNELVSITLKNANYVYGWQHNNQIYTWDMAFRASKYFDSDGQLALNPGRVEYLQTLDTSFFIKFWPSKKCEIIPIIKKEKNVSQLTLRTDKEEFQTYIFMDEKTQQIINKYYTFRSKKISEEKDRQKEEERTVRTFKVANFGIYNWDKLINLENRIYFAADFQFETPIEYNNITIFLITDLNGNAVVKYYRDAWQAFSIDPSVSNKIIAILPENKIAVFSAEEMKKVNWESVKKNGKYIFKMKTIDKKIENVSMLETYL